MYDDFSKGHTVYEDNFQGGGHDAMGRGTGYYRDQVTYDKPIFFNFTAADMETGSDDVDINSDVYKNLKKSLSSNSGNINGSEVSIVGGASAVGSKQGYDNKALAGRRAEKLKAQLIKDIPGLATKVKFKVTSIVGTSDKFNSPEALKEQFVMVSISIPGKGIIKTNSEVDNTAVDTGFKVIRDEKNKFKFDKPMPESRICLRIPSNLESDFKLALKEFKDKHLLKTIPFSITPVKK
jgi:hypothetical protein